MMSPGSFCWQKELRLNRRQLLLGTTSFIVYASIPAKAQTPLVRRNAAFADPGAPIIALDPASDLGASNTDNISNDPLASLVLTVNSSISEGTIIEILDNGVTYASHRLTAKEISTEIIAKIAKPRSDGEHKITARVTKDGNTSSLSNTLVYLLDTSITTPTISGTTPSSDARPGFKVTFGAIKPVVGDILCLLVNGLENARKTLGPGDLSSTVINANTLAVGRYAMAAYIYSPTGNNKFSLVSNSFHQLITGGNFYT